MNTFRLSSRGHFAGEFLITTDAMTYSIGNYVEVKALADHPLKTDKTVLSLRGDREIPIYVFPLLVKPVCQEGILEVELQSVPSRTYIHWVDCLNKDTFSVVMSSKHTNRKYSWYTPKIDGWVMAMLGRERAQITTNRGVAK